MRWRTLAIRLVRRTWEGDTNPPGKLSKITRLRAHLHSVTHYRRATPISHNTSGVPRARRCWRGASWLALHRVFLGEGEAVLVIARKYFRVDFVASARQRAPCWSIGESKIRRNRVSVAGVRTVTPFLFGAPSHQ